MLTELLTDKTIQITDKKLDWEEAIELTAQPLLKEKAIEDKYITAMIGKVKEFGAFINVGDRVALPHARPEDGVNKVGISLLKTNETVYLLDKKHHPIKLFICLAATDNKAHLEALADLTKLLIKKDSLNALLKAETKQEILDVIKEGESK
ncbi:MAG: PTS sugar transporter subunit IIA [Micrococcaceae bacterium]